MNSIVVDTSAIIAVLNDEEGADAFRQAFHEADLALVSAATLLESSCVVAHERFIGGSVRLAKLIALLDLTCVPFDQEQLEIAQATYVRFGKGSGHPANLNLGDCFSYALAASRGLPLLFKGDDFVHTDVRSALAPA